MKKYLVRFEDDFVAVSVFELDLKCAVVEEFGGSFALDFVAFFATDPMEADRVARVFDFETGLQGAEGDFAALRGDRQPRGAAKVQVSAIPEVGLNDPPAADEVGSSPRPSRAGLKEPGSRARL